MSADANPSNEVFVFRFARLATAIAVIACASAVPARAAAHIQVDVPAANAVLPESFIIGGWMLDFAAKSDPGVAFAHVWLYPASGAAPFFVGEVTHGPRPDVAAAFGSQFLQSGFSFLVRNIPPGQYWIVMTPWSTLTNGFQYGSAAAVPITISASAKAIPMPPPSGPAPSNPAPQPPAPQPAPTGGTDLRVLQWNTHHGGYGTDGVYSPDRLATWAASFTPDVVMFNEIERNDSWGNQDQPEVYKSLLQQKTGKTWYYVFAQEFGQWNSTGKGNLILSSYPISITDRYELAQNGDRSIAMATITVNNRDITLISTHLDPYDQTLRLAQATEVTNWAAGQPENRIITGDMNAWPNQSSIAEFDQHYDDTWTVAAGKGTAIAFSGNSGETKSGRIDFIFASKNASNLTVKSSQVYDTRDSNGVTPSDHRPVLTVFSVR
jgi:endonuclease/exonuclease/phosphatase family metal-dependent hydrolase